MTTHLSSQALDALKHAHYAANVSRLFLIREELPEKVYREVKEVCARLGGRWNTGGHAFLFSYDPTQALEVVQASGQMPPRNSYAFFPSPDPVSEDLLRYGFRLFDRNSCEGYRHDQPLHVCQYLLPDLRILEPSAGDGAVARRVRELSAGLGREDYTLHCCELNPINREVLRRQGFQVVAREPEEFHVGTHPDSILSRTDGGNCCVPIPCASSERDTRSRGREPSSAREVRAAPFILRITVFFFSHCISSFCPSRSSLPFISHTHRKRLPMKHIREHLQMYGPAGLSTLDLLTLTLTQKTEPQILVRLTQVLQQYDVRRLRSASISELQHAGLTRSQAERLVAICELTRRLALLEAEPLPQIKAPDDAVALLKPLLEDRDQEIFRVLVLNTKHQVLENSELYRGTIHSMEVRVAEILRPAVIRKSPAILVAHVHPSGNPEASAQDIAMTEQLVQAGKLLDIEIVDHLILGHASYTSLRTKLRW